MNYEAKQDEVKTPVPVSTTDWLDAGVLVLLFIGEMWLWWITGLSWIVLTYGFICAVRGSQLSSMRKDGVWKRIWRGI